MGRGGALSPWWWIVHCPLHHCRDTWHGVYCLAKAFTKAFTIYSVYFLCCRLESVVIVRSSVSTMRVGLKWRMQNYFSVKKVCMCCNRQWTLAWIQAYVFVYVTLSRVLIGVYVFKSYSAGHPYDTAKVCCLTASLYCGIGIAYYTTSTHQLRQL